MKQIDESSNAKQIDLTAGETLELRLTENRTTGFKWVVESAGDPVCKVISDSYEASEAVGQAGSHLWRFSAQNAGEAEIALAYRRPWDETQTPAHTFTLRVRVSR